MNTSKINLSHVEFVPVRFSRDFDRFLGRVSFIANGFISFRNLAVFKAPGDGLLIDFPAVDPTGSGLPMIRDDIRRKIEAQVASAIEEFVR